MQAPALNTTFSRLNKISLIVALTPATDNTTQGATGDLFWDDGTTRDTYNKGQYLSVQYEASQNSTYTVLRCSVKHDGIQQDTALLQYDVIQVWGVASVQITPTLSRRHVLHVPTGDLQL